jgi:hypothetical protein
MAGMHHTPLLLLHPMVALVSCELSESSSEVLKQVVRY